MKYVFHFVCDKYKPFIVLFGMPKPWFQDRIKCIVDNMKANDFNL